jgi:hypothetical protein
VERGRRRRRRRRRRQRGNPAETPVRGPSEIEL